MSVDYQPPVDIDSRKVAGASEIMTGLNTTWCPGCGHGTAATLIADTIAELGIRDQTILCAGVGCGTSIVAQLDVHAVSTPHGRASDTATGMSRMLPDRVVFQYSGDGDACGIGLAGLIHACARGENFIVFIYNNNVYGMTGGQVGPTTSPEVPTTTFQSGRDATVMGHPIDIIKTLESYPGVAYSARAALASGVLVKKAAKAVKKAFQIHLDGVRGIKIVDLLGNCNVNWKGGGVTFNPQTANEFIESTIMKSFVMGEVRVPEGYAKKPERSSGEEAK
jgi:pyruvate/2-oxoacid:ferredoxin oxidoreductase beta subunit